MFNDYKIIKKYKNCNYKFYLVEKDNKYYFIKELYDINDSNISNIKREVQNNKIFSYISNIPKMIDYNLDDEKKYIIYEFIEGGNLKNKVFNIEKSVEICINICDLLNEFHNNGYVFGDLKRSNLIYNKNGLYIIDLATVIKIGEPLNYATMDYCSPYQKKDRKAKIEFDFYALGIVFYELLSNVNPIKEKDKNNSLEIKTISKIILNINKELERIINKLLSNNIDDNYKNIDEIKKDLFNYLKR